MVGPATYLCPVSLETVLSGGDKYPLSVMYSSSLQHPEVNNVVPDETGDSKLS